MNFIVWINQERSAEFVEKADAMTWARHVAGGTESTVVCVDVRTGEAFTVENSLKGWRLLV